MDELAIGLCRDEQNLRGLTRLNQALRQAEPIHETRATQIEIEGARPRRKAQAML